MFITFEGGEGVGKSTQVAMLMEYLEKSGQEAILVRQPGGTKICEAIRDIILSTNNSEMCAECEALLYAAARAQLMREVIQPAIKKGVIVVCDRHLDSSLAYQGFARGLGVDQVQEINKMAIDGTDPDVTIFLDLPHDKMFRPKEKVQKYDDRLEPKARHSTIRYTKGLDSLPSNTQTASYGLNRRRKKSRRPLQLLRRYAVGAQ